jgi:hypothetical protein
MRLILAPDETIYRLDLGLFPALSHIAIDEAEPAFNAMLARLPAGNRVATISLGILFFDDESSVDTKRLQEFDTTALGRNMSALLRVTAKVMAARSRSLTSPEQAEIAHTIQTALPCLHAKGLLVTVFE